MVQMSTKSDDAYATLRDEIESGARPAGSALAELAIVADLGISRTPVREALARLIDDGLAVRDGARGSVRVSAVSIADVQDLFGFRIILEGAGMRELAAAVASGRAETTTLQELRTRIGALQRRAHSPARSADFYGFAEQFDAEVMRTTPNPLVGQAIADLRPRTRRLRSIAHRSAERETASMREHLAMLDALLAGEPDRAEAACRRHLENTAAEVIAGAARGLAVTPSH